MNFFSPGEIAASRREFFTSILTLCYFGILTVVRYRVRDEVSTVDFFFFFEISVSKR